MPIPPLIMPELPDIALPSALDLTALQQAQRQAQRQAQIQAYQAQVQAYQARVQVHASQAVKRSQPDFRYQVYLCGTIFYFRGELIGTTPGTTLADAESTLSALEAGGGPEEMRINISTVILSQD